MLIGLMQCNKIFINLKEVKYGIGSLGLLTKQLLGLNGCTRISKMKTEISIETKQGWLFKVITRKKGLTMMRPFTL